MKTVWIALTIQYVTIATKQYVGLIIGEGVTVKLISVVNVLIVGYAMVVLNHLTTDLKHMTPIFNCFCANPNNLHMVYINFRIQG